MGKNAPFGRPGARDRLRLWWSAKDRSFRANSLLGLVVGGVAVGLVAAAVSREPAPSTGLANAARPHLTTGNLPNPPMTVDIRTAGGVATPLGIPEPSSSTSSTVATVAAPASSSTTTTPPVRPATTATTSPPVVATTAPPAFVYTEVPLPPPPPAADPTVPPLPTTTRPTATTVVTLLPPISLPPLPPLLP